MNAVWIRSSPFKGYRMHTSQMLRHPGEGRDPVCAPKTWIPAFAGMTNRLSQQV